MRLLAIPASLNPCLQSSNSTLFTKLPALRRLNLLPPNRRRYAYASSTSSEQSVSSEFITSVGSSSPPNLPQWSFTQQHLLSVNFIACTAAAVSATWLFCAAIPTLLAFKRAAESLEKLLNVTREELPGTMAAIRLSGMEISDLTMELSDLGQEINKGVTSSTRAVRVAEERLRRLTNMSPSAPMQGIISVETKTAGPVLAQTARGIREVIVKGRGLLQMLFTLTKFSGMVLNLWKSRAKERP